MPGKYDANSSAVNYLSPWFIHRTLAQAVSDDLAHPENVLSTLDFAKNFQSFQALDNKIWVTPVRFAGTGSINLALVIENNGSLLAWNRFTVVDSLAMNSGEVAKFSSLLAGVYRLLVTGSSGVWNLHCATSMPPEMLTSPMETRFLPMLDTGQLWLKCSDGFYYRLVLTTTGDSVTVTIDAAASVPPLYGLDYIVLTAPENVTNHKVTLTVFRGSVYLDVDQQVTTEAATPVSLKSSDNFYYNFGLAYVNGSVTTNISQTHI